MADTTFWTDNWMDLQRQYWEQWTQLQQKAMGTDSAVANPWEAAMNHWWEAVSGSLPDLSRDFLGKTMDQGKAFFRMADELSRLAGKDENAWQEVIDNLARSFTQTSSAAGSDYAAGFWEMPLDNWQRIVSTLSPLPGDMLRGMPTTGFKENMDRILGAPGLGYTRESQEQYQSLSQSVLAYQEALAEYSLFFGRMGERAAMRLGDLVKEKPVESARGLYDAWIHCCEEEYAEQVMTPEYTKLHGTLVNALMRVKHRWGELLSEYLSAMNIPTQEDLRTLQRRVQEHRREIRALHKEIAELRKTVESAGTAPAAPVQRKPTQARPATVKKASAKKKTPARKKAATKKA